MNPTSQPYNGGPDSAHPSTAGERSPAISDSHEAAVSQAAPAGEQRVAADSLARHLLDTALRARGLPHEAYHVGCGGELDAHDQAAVDAINSALGGRVHPEPEVCPQCFWVNPGGPRSTSEALTDDRKSMLVGTLLDHWEGTPNDLKAEVREFGCGKQLDDLLRYMQDEQPVPVAPKAQSESVAFQERVAAWMDKCFLPSLYSNMTERGDRLLEEVLELLQSTGYDRARVATLVSYVFGRPAGEPSQEVGGVMVTLAGFCWIAGLDMHADGDRELSRISQPDVMAKIRRKQEAKNALHFDTPLPGATDQQRDAQA